MNKMAKHMWTPEEEKKLVEAYKTMRLHEMAEMFGVTYSAIDSKLRDLGVERMHCGGEYSRIHNYNEHYFDVIDDENKAYWLGLIYADGNIGDRRFELLLQETDSEILDLFLKDIGAYSVKPKTKYDKGYIRKRIVLMSKKLVAGLKSRGICKRKSYTDKFPMITGKFLKHFFRGVFDGNGCISIDKRVGQRKAYPVLTVTHRKKFNVWLDEQLQKYVRVNKGSIVNLKSEGIANLVYYGNRKVLPLYEWMYAGAKRYLPRKYNRFKEVFKECGIT